MDRGNITLSSYSGWYSVRDEAFFAENELVNGVAPTGAPVEWVENHHISLIFQNGSNLYLIFIGHTPIL